MGKRFTSVRLGVQSVTERGEMAAGRLDRAGRDPGGKLAGLARNHPRTAFSGCDKTLEVTLFSVLLDTSRDPAGGNGDVDS